MPHNVLNSFNSIVSPVPDIDVKYNCKVRYYPDDQIKITCFSKPIFNPLHVEEYIPGLMGIDPETKIMSYKYVKGKTLLDPFTNQYMPFTVMREKRETENTRVRTDSIKRAIDKAFEIGLANDFQYFITLTLDKSKIDRYNTDIIYPKLKNFLKNMVQRNGMDYILFPEYHQLENGQTQRAIHFHGLINAHDLKLTDSGRKTKNGQTIFNLDGWKYGFSTVIKLDGRTAVVRYVTKYITKGNERILRKSYLSGGKTLKREVPAEFLNIDYVTFDGKEYHIPAAAMSVKYKTYNLGFTSNATDDDEMEVL